MTTARQPSHPTSDIQKNVTAAQKKTARLFRKCGRKQPVPSPGHSDDWGSVFLCVCVLCVCVGSQRVWTEFVEGGGRASRRWTQLEMTAMITKSVT